MYDAKSRTPIAYYGGKQSMLTKILPLLGEHSAYTEVFFGGGAVFFAKEKVKNETINDQWDICINFYEQVRRNFKPLKEYIEATLISRTLHQRAQQVLRRPEEADKVLLAWASWMCANWSYANKVTYGGIKFSNHQNSSEATQLRNKKARFTGWLVHRLEDAYIECNDACTVLRSRNVPEAVHYIDPPCPNADQGHYRGYGWNQYEKLLDTCKDLKGRFILSGYNSAMLQRYIDRNGWHKYEFDMRLQAGKLATRRKTETLVLNYLPGPSNKLF